MHWKMACMYWKFYTRTYIVQDKIERVGQLLSQNIFSSMAWRSFVFITNIRATSEPQGSNRVTL